MGLTIDFTKVESKLDALSKKVSTQLLDECLDAGNKPVLNTMKKNCPVDTRELQSNLGELRKEGSGLNRKSLLGINADDRSVIERGYYLEHGTCCIVGRHWMSSSFDQSKKEANEAIKKKLQESLKL